MQTMTIESATKGGGSVADDAVRAICAVLEDGGLVCLPCGGSYRIIADLTDPDAVTRLLQAKRRTSKSPALVFVADAEMLSAVTAEISEEVRRLGARFWPGPLTVLVVPSEDLPRKVTKQLATNAGRFGVRVPQDALASSVVRTLGRPVLVSSANRQKKQGAGSPAQVRKNFVSHIDLFVDAGDLPPCPPSTVVAVEEGGPVVIRPGAIGADALHATAS